MRAMSLLGWKDRLLSQPWIYDGLRPLVVGGLDLGVLGDFCEIRRSDRVFDLGCGTAQMLGHLSCDRYLGVDLDEAALAKASRRSTDRIRFLAGDAWDSRYTELQPTVVLMIGVVHHLSDGELERVIRRLSTSAHTLDRIVAIDVTYFRGRVLNNLLSRLDRGRYVREVEEYEQLYARCGLKILRRGILHTRMRYVSYIGYHLGFSAP